jgi:hypothetical protein
MKTRPRIAALGVCVGLVSAGTAVVAQAPPDAGQEILPAKSAASRFELRM